MPYSSCLHETAATARAEKMNSIERRFPRILVVNEYSPDARPLADLFRQLLSGYPVEKIAWWHCRHTQVYEKPDLQAGKVYHFTMPEKLVPQRRWTAAKSFVLENFWMPMAVRHLRRTVSEVRPEVVWVHLNDWPGITAARAGLQNVLQHVSLWDYHNTNGRLKIYGASRARRFLNEAFAFIKRANTYDTLCTNSMGEIHSQVGRKDGIIVHSGFEPRHIQTLESITAKTQNDNVIRLAYAGTIVSENGFFALLEVLSNIRRAFPRKIILEFFGGRGYARRDWFRPDWMTEYGVFTDQGLIEALSRCSWGIVVMDPTGEDLQYSKFSFPNKVGSYLSAGVPVLGYGHSQSCLGMMMQDYRLGCFTSATEASALKKFLLDALHIQKPNEFFRGEILRCAKTEFNSTEMREQLWHLWGVRP
jgi:hypothetical protein